MERSKRRWFIIAALALCLGLVWLRHSLVLPPAPETTRANVQVSQPAPPPTADTTTPSLPAAAEPARETAAPEPESAVGGGTLQGRVIDAATRLPVKEFELRLRPFSKYPIPSDKPPITRAFNSASGRFAWKSAPVGNWTLLVVARGYQGFELTEVNVVSGKSTREVVLPLLRGHTLMGRVFDEDSGAAVRDASIRFREQHEQWYSRHATARQTAKTKEDGSFALEGVPAGRLTLSVGAANYAPQDMNITVRDKTPPLEIPLSKGGAVTGYLASADGTPVAGSVMLQNLESRSSNPGNRGDQTGEFSFEHLPAGRYRLSGNSSVGAATKEIVLAQDERLEGVVLTLSPGRTVRGVVRGLRPEQLAETIVAVHSIEKPGVRASSQVNEQGSYALPGVAPGRAQITVFGSTRQLHKEISVPADQDLTLNFDFPAGFPLHGRVSQRGKPVAGHNVFVRPAGPSQQTFYNTRTSEQGAYEIEGLTAGEYDVVADGIAPRRINMLGDTVLDLELPATELGGRVLEEGSDIPIVGVGIHLTGTEAATANVHIYKETDHFGRFALSGLDEGAILLSIYKPGYEMFRERITYSSPITTKTVRLRPSNGVEIKAQVVATGRPRNWLFVVEKSGETLRGISLRVQLDENGVGSLPSALAHSTLEIHGGGPTPTVVKEWDGQSLDLKF
jgi:hypothetical protein